MSPKPIPFIKMEKFYQKLETEAKSLDEAVLKAVNTVKQDFDRKRTELKDKLNRYKTEEQELINIFKQSDIQLQQEITRIGIVVEGLSTGQSELQQFETQDFHRRSQLMNQIFSDTHREVENLIRDLKDKIRRVDQMAYKSMPKNSIDTTQIRTFIEQRKTVSNDLINRLQDIRREIDKSSKSMTELEENESKELTETEKKCSNEEMKERKEEANNFKKKAIECFGKK